MGYSTYAVGIVGMRLEPGVIAAKLYTEEMVRGCNHIMRDTAKFCEKCGAAEFVFEHKPIKEFDEDGEEQKLCGYTLVARGSEDYDNPEFIAYYWTEHTRTGTSTFPMNTLERLPTIQDEMQRKLEPLGLWDRKMFGVHVFLYESC